MQTLESLRRQIDTATDLRSVVTTMKTLAAVSIHQYERAVDALADYNRTIEFGFQIALADEPFEIETPETAAITAAIVFGSNQGMCGQFNEEIASLVNARSHTSDSDPRWLLLTIGSRVEGQFLESGWSIQRNYDIPTSVNDITDLVQKMLPQIEQLRSEADVRRLFVFFNRRESASTFQPRQLQLLPIDPVLVRRWQQKPWDSRSLPVFVTERRQLLSRLVRQYLFVSLFSAAPNRWPVRMPVASPRCKQPRKTSKNDLMICTVRSTNCASRPLPRSYWTW